MGGLLACGGCGDAGTETASSADSVTGVVATLSPSTDLVDGQQVTLRVEGTLSGEITFMRLCRLEPGGAIPSSDRCPLAGGALVPVNGVIEQTFHIFASTAGINCQLDACALYIEGGNFAVNPPVLRFHEIVPVSFRSIGTPPLSPPLSVTPSTGLADRQQVTVRGSGFLPNLFMTVGQCRADAQSFAADCMAITTPIEARTTASGELDVAATVRYRVEPSQGEPFDCTAGSCVMVAAPTRQELVLAEAGRAALTFDVDTNPGPVQRGTLQLDRTSVTSGDAVLVTGSGWAPRATVRYTWCGSARLGACTPEMSIQVAADGTFTTHVTATRLLVQEGVAGPSLASAVECVTPTTCALHAYDLRDRAATQVSTPIGVAVRPGVSAAFDLRAPLVADMSVRVVGSGFTPNGSVDLWQCGEFPGKLCGRVARIPTDASGSVRGYSRLAERIVFFVIVECGRPDSTCNLFVTDGAGVVNVPLQFATGAEFDVTSNYEAKWQPLLQQGLDSSGASPGEFQRQGASVLLWVMAASGARSAAHFPTGGDLSYTTTYARQSYIDMTNLAASYDYTLDELQKSGTLFWSWVLAGQPPLPTGE
ncbi:MAG TPA: neocarzinostatin apoprotein domain-containing protein [Polyangiaceae bacterium]